MAMGSSHSRICGGASGGGAIGATGLWLSHSTLRMDQCVYAWHRGATGDDYVMLGKLDAAGFGGDYVTPGMAYGNSAIDSGWIPSDARPLFRPGDELHIHASGVGSIAYATIYYTPQPCP